MTVPVKLDRKLPAKLAPVKFKHFYEFVDDCDALVEHYDWLCEVKHDILFCRAHNIPCRKLEEIEALPRIHALYVDLIKGCEESLRRYDHDDDDARYDDDGDLSFEHVRARLALMLQSWSNAKFDDEEAAQVFGRTMVEHVLARVPTAVELEACCRRLIDEGAPFIPQTPEVIKVLKAEQAVWERRKQAIRDADWLYREIIEELIPEEKARREAEQKAAAAAEARRKQQRIDDAYLRGLNWLLGSNLPIGSMLYCGKEFRWYGRDDELVAYGSACFEVAAARREDFNARVRDGRCARDCENRRRHVAKLIRRGRRHAAKWRLVSRMRRGKAPYRHGDQAAA